MAALIIMAVSCKKDPSLKATYEGANVAAEGGKATIKVKSNIDWKVTNSDSWVTAYTPAEGKGDADIAVTFAANTGTQERSSTFTVKGKDLAETVVIKQSGASESLTVEYTATEIAGNGGTATFTIKSNMNWTIAAQNAAWLTPDPASGSGDAMVTVTVAANDGAAREGTLKVTAGSLSETVTIKQAEAVAPELTVDYTPADIPGTGGTAVLTVKSNTNWTVAAQGGATWLSPNPASGNGNATVNVTVSANDGAARQGTINVTAGSIVVPVVINQLAAVPGALSVDDLVGEWAVTSTFTNSDGSYPANHTATFVKIDANTIRIDAFLGSAALMGKTVELDSQTFTFDPDNNTLTIIDPNKTEVTWNDEYFCFIAVLQQDTYVDNIGLPFPVYTVVNTNGALSIDFRDPNGLANGTAECCVIASDKETGAGLGAFGYFSNTDFKKSGGNPAPAINNGPKVDRNAPYTNKAR